MDTLWAPWRMEFIGAEKPKGCIFCLFPAEAGFEADKKNLILGRSRQSFAILNRYPYNSAHLMVVPRRHTGNFESLAGDELSDLHGLLQLSVALLKEAYRPQGFNIGMNLDKSAGAGIADHLHYHVVPRWDGDTNFMPVLASSKVIVEHLYETYAKLHPLFSQRLSVHEGAGGA